VVAGEVADAQGTLEALRVALRRLFEDLMLVECDASTGADAWSGREAPAIEAGGTRYELWPTVRAGAGAVEWRPGGVPGTTPDRHRRRWTKYLSVPAGREQAADSAPGGVNSASQ
jgi:hypothetical protein